MNVSWGSLTETQGKSLEPPVIPYEEDGGSCLLSSGVLHLIDNSLERCGIVESQVGKHLAVDFDAGLVDKTHELRVREILHTGGGVDTLDPESAEIALLVLTVAVSVGKTFFPGILGYGPYVAAATEVTAG